MSPAFRTATEQAFEEYLRLSRLPPSAERASGEPGLIVSFPASNLNRYQDLLYAHAGRYGFAVVFIAGLDELARIHWAGPVVFHAHWFQSIFKDLADEAEARQAVEAALLAIVAFGERTGARLLWTAHNVFPHSAKFPEAALFLRRRTVELFDAVHLMSPNHKPVLEEAFSMPLGRHFVVPHPTYAGVYPDTIDRHQARKLLRLGDDDVVLLSFGAIREYKRIDLLLDAFAKVKAKTPRQVRLLIAGAPLDPALAESLAKAGKADAAIRVRAERIDDAEVQNYFHAADVLVLPYQSSLNSGAAMAAVTFGVPVIGPDAPAFRHLKSLGVTTYEASDPGGLVRVLTDFVAGGRATRPPRFPSALEALEPRAVSERFFSEVTRLL